MDQFCRFCSARDGGVLWTSEVEPTCCECLCWNTSWQSLLLSVGSVGVILCFHLPDQSGCGHQQCETFTFAPNPCLRDVACALVGQRTCETGGAFTWQRDSQGWQDSCMMPPPIFFANLMLCQVQQSHFLSSPLLHTQFCCCSHSHSDLLFWALAQGSCLFERVIRLAPPVNINSTWSRSTFFSKVKGLSMRPLLQSTSLVINTRMHPQRLLFEALQLGVKRLGSLKPIPDVLLTQRGHRGDFRPRLAQVSSCRTHLGAATSARTCTTSCSSSETWLCAITFQFLSGRCPSSHSS